MKKFLLTILLFLAIPILLLQGVYLVTDPYKTLHPFSLDSFDSTNRDYLSTELFFQNYPSQQYDSYIFGSSRGCGLNTYHWLKYLPQGSKQFLFQAWGETLTGIEQKITYLDEQGCNLCNVMLLFDSPGTFVAEQQPTEALAIKHPTTARRPFWIHQVILFYDFIQKPSQWVKAMKTWKQSEPSFVNFDSITNDWDSKNKERDLSCPPPKDSLQNCSLRTREVFLKSIEGMTPDDMLISEPMINARFENQLQHIKSILDKHHTDYRIVVTPGYCYTSPKLHTQDLQVLNRVFGEEYVFDYSGKNFLTADYNNFSDPNHFGLYVGWYIIEDIYGKNHQARMAVN